MKYLFIFPEKATDYLTLADYLDFYGTRARGGITKYYTIDNVVYYTKDEYYNFYSDTNAYWIGWDGSNGIRYNNPSYTSTTPYGSSSYFETFHSEKIKFIHREKDRARKITETSTTNSFRRGWYLGKHVHKILQ